MIALFLIRAYRKIPASVRRMWSFSSSTSHLALSMAENGNPWRAIWNFGRIGFQAGGWMPFPSWTDPGPQGQIGLAWKLGEGGKGAP